MSDTDEQKAATADEPSEAPIEGRLCSVWGHLGWFFLFKILKVRHRRAMREAMPIALHLENEIFPGLRARREPWLTLHVSGGDDQSWLRGSSGRRDFQFPGTSQLAACLRALDIDHVRLDTSLEYGQIVQSFLVILHAGKALDDAEPRAGDYAGWRARTVASLMLGPSGFHKICAKMTFDRDRREYEVAYSYCELFFSRAIRDYVERRPRLQDHRALFIAAPRIALLVLLLLSLPGIVLLRSNPTSMIVYVVFTLLAGATVGLSIYAIGSMQYTLEHHEELSQTYYNQVTILSRFPETNPNPIVKLDPEGNPLYTNPAARALLRSLDLDEQSPARILPENYRELIAHCLDEHVSRHEVEVGRHGRVMRYIFSPFPDERAVIVAGSDVTHLKEIERELRDLNLHLEDLVEARTHELQETQDVTILCLAGLAEIRDPETGAHLHRTRLYVKALAEQLRHHPRFRDYLTDEAIEKLYKSSPLHDIGKVGVRDAILLKPGRLTHDLFDEMKKHTIHGGDALRWAEERLGFDSFLSVAREIAYSHHERWDGTGYPHGLKEDEIPISGRLMSLADVYDALTSERVYKRAIPHEKAVEMILEGRATQFDPAVVDAFLDIEDEFIQISRQFRDVQIPV